MASLVTPGLSSVTARGLPRILLKSVLFPVLTLPMMATRGSFIVLYILRHERGPRQVEAIRPKHYNLILKEA
jgi:hypothetical protein